jgi:hypothetical protein
MHPCDSLLRKTGIDYRKNSDYKGGAFMSQDVTTNVESELMVTIIDSRRALHGIMPVWRADMVLASLVAEPESLEELEDAITRYDASIISQGFLNHLETGVNETPWDAGVVIIDLTARLIAGETEPAIYIPERHGFALYCADPPLDWFKSSQEELIQIPYLVSQDWLYASTLADWRGVAERRSVEREATPPLDARPVLLGKVAEFIARQCAIAQAAGKEDPIAEIHEAWLMTPREDLRGQTPREVLLAKLEFIDHDLFSRELQWSLTCVRPPILNQSSAAYRFAGFGTHSNFVYFEMIRHLLDECWLRARTGQSLPIDDEITHMEERQVEYLTEGRDMTYTPGWFLEQERLRIPILAPENFDDLADPEFTLPRAAEDPTLGMEFMRLCVDHMNAEGNFAFSLYATHEEWESERHVWGAPQCRHELVLTGGEKVYSDQGVKVEDETDDDEWIS